ncbi:MAG TPA: PQQ-binding-like beta-propeller repeat protein [Acidimicrobiia bacterium]
MALGWNLPSVDGPIAADSTNNALWAMDKGAQKLDEVNAANGAVEHAYNVPLDSSEHFPTPAVSSNGQWVVIESADSVVGIQTGSAGPNPTWKSATLDGIVQSRPVIVNNVVVVATENDSVYGLSLATGAFVWTTTDGTTSDHGQTLGTPESQAQNNSLDSGAVNGCGDIWPLGITSNLVVAPNGSVYAVGEAQTGTTNTDKPDFKMMAVNPADGSVTLAPTSIAPTSMKTAPVQIEAEQQRAGLLTANNDIYIGFGGLAGDCGTYHGYDVAVSQAGSIVGDLEVTANSNAGAIWATAGGAVDGANNVYVSTGNGQGSPGTGTDYSDGVIDVPPSMSGELTAPTNYFQPLEWQSDNNADADLGSNGPVLVANGTKLFIIGKQHNAFLLSTSSLGGSNHETPLGRLNGVCSGVSDGQNATLGSSAYFNCSSAGMWQVTLS